ncbi:hypothetical protein HYDPIDRAFT_116712 [Hydnomerulius pinastri MD-312]|uniref:Uncharacterized protein n=1 Tax=Hydnomerulius pinastri MD-312 TaxID=994086 RepID=A0A0C9VSH3_9AGAM|nr:hypothetical protein HYDPIDRAFT_116712 [Hydnomerulius pinastri MD-312]
MATNMLIFFMTFWKYFSLPTEWTHGDIGRVVFRDSALSMIAVSLLMLFLTLCTLGVIKTSMSGNVTYYWLVCTLWISSGRIIINLARLPAREEGFTSEIELGEPSVPHSSPSGLANAPGTDTYLTTALSGDTHSLTSKGSEFRTSVSGSASSVIHGATGRPSTDTCRSTEGSS